MPDKDCVVTIIAHFFTERKIQNTITSSNYYRTELAIIMSVLPRVSITLKWIIFNWCRPAVLTINFKQVLVRWIALPIWHLFVQTQQWNHQSNVWNLFKVNNKDPRHGFHRLLWCLYCWLWTSKCRLGNVFTGN